MAGFDNPIGIDLGTTNCCIGFVQNGRVEIIPNIVTDERTTPSYVFFDGIKTHVGKLAVTNAVLHPERVVYDSKRMIGRRFDDNNIQKNLVYWRFHVEEGRDSKPVIQISKKHGVVTYTPEDISSIILRQLKSYAEKFTGKPVKNAVITVPAYFNYNQRTATQRAAEDAGFHVLQIINEPTAAALAYVDINYKDTNCENTILIYDLGGGTFDVSILRVEKNENEQVFKVLATSGDTYLGGRDFDNNLIELILKKIEGKDVKVTNKLKRRISALVTKTKIDLTEAETADVILPFVASVDDDEDFVININREEFEEVNLDLFKRTIDILRKCLDDANIEKKQINEVVLVGGSSKIPKIRKMIKEFFGNVNVSESVSSSEAVAYGATLKAWTFDEESSKSLIISDVTPLSIGLEVLGGTIDCILRRNTSIPKEVTRKCHTSLDKQKSMMFAIYEGERLLAKDNTKLGSFILDLPEKPIGYSIPVSFCLDENGILNVHAEIETGIYRNLQITYEATDVAKATNVIQEAALAKTVDASVARRIDQIVNFEIYLNRVLALCQRCTAFTESEKDTLTNTSEECLKVLKAFTAGNVTEEIAEEALDKREVVEGIIEPILELHEIRIKYKTSEEFYKMLINM